MWTDYNFWPCSNSDVAPLFHVCVCVHFSSFLDFFEASTLFLVFFSSSLSEHIHTHTVTHTHTHTNSPSTFYFFALIKEKKRRREIKTERKKAKWAAFTTTYTEAHTHRHRRTKLVLLTLTTHSPFRTTTLLVNFTDYRDVHIELRSKCV